MERTRQIVKTTSIGSDESGTFEVWIGTLHVADLIDTGGGSKSGWELEYASEWQDSPSAFALSPALPLGRRHGGAVVSNFFENYLPEGEELQELRRIARVDRTNVIGLARALQNDLPGAVRLRLPLSEEDREEHVRAVESANVFRRITDEEMLERLRGAAAMSIWDNRYRLSVAGVQRKLNVMRREGDWGVVDGPDWASTHILKFASEDMPMLVLNEYLTMRLAALSGFPTAEVRMVDIGGPEGVRVLEVERFDRRWRPDLGREGTVLRTHVIDACQATGLSVARKYEQPYGSGRDVADIRDGVSWPLVTDLVASAEDPQRFLVFLWSAFVFNLIVGNSDAHGKNWSFFVTAKGLRPTPLYDLVNVAVLRETVAPQLDTRLAMAVGNAFERDRVSIEDWSLLAVDCDFPLERIHDCLCRVTGKVAGALDAVGKEVEALSLRDDEVKFASAWRRSVEEGVALARRWEDEIERMLLHTQ